MESNLIQINIDSFNEIPKHGMIPIEVTTQFTKKQFISHFRGCLLVLMQDKEGRRVVYEALLDEMGNNDIETDSKEDKAQELMKIAFYLLDPKLKLKNGEIDDEFNVKTLDDGDMLEEAEKFRDKKKRTRKNSTEEVFGKKKGVRKHVSSRRRKAR